MTTPADPFCQLELGVFARRRCAEHAIGTCSQCGRRICGMHFRSAEGRCFLCAPAASAEPARSPARRTDDDDLYDAAVLYSVHRPTPFATESSATSAPAPWEGGGGDFGGGGASGRFGDAGTFGPDDYAAFDRTTQHDQRRGLSSYDS